MRYAPVPFRNGVLMRLTMFAALAIATATMPLSGQTVHNGRDVLALMQKRYDGKWFSSLTFNQQTTMRRGDSNVVQTWHESLLWNAPTGAWLRIDTGDPALGNGSLTTWDSTWGVRGGKARPPRGDGNPFIALIENVYMQPVDVTVKQLAPLNFDLAKVGDATWEGRPAWIVGATSASDSTSPQFWVDKERLVLVRMRINLGRVYDIHLDKLESTAGGWLATKVTMFSGDVPVQTEEYSDWKSNVPLDRRLFDPATWSTATHWFKP